MASATLYFITISILYVTVEGQKPITAWDGTQVDVPEFPKLADDMNYEYKEYYHPNSEEGGSFPHKIMDVYVQQQIRNQIVNYTDDSHLVSDNFVEQADCSAEKDKNCCSESKVMRPYFGKKDDHVVMVLQAMLFKQTIKVTRCVQYEDECFTDVNFGSWETKCRTNYGTTHLFVYNPATKKTESVPFAIPVSCSCHIGPKPLGDYPDESSY